MNIQDSRKDKHENNNIFDCANIQNGYNVNDVVKFVAIACFIFLIFFTFGIIVYFLGFRPWFIVRPSRYSRVIPQLGGDNDDLIGLKAVAWGGFFGFCGVLLFLGFSVYRYNECKRGLHFGSANQ